MLRELRIAAVAAVVLTVGLGLVYPLAMTGVAQVVFPGKANGSVVTRRTAVASHRIAQDFSQNRGYFQSRPSVTGYDPSGTQFNNQGPNQKELAGQLKRYLAAYLERERAYTPNLTAAQVPVDAVTTSASGVDPDISAANARIQANRVARERGLPLRRVLQIVDDHASRPLFGLGGPKSINVVDANLALDEASHR